MSLPDTARMMQLVEEKTGCKVSLSTVTGIAADAEMLTATPDKPMHLIMQRRKLISLSLAVVMVLSTSALATESYVDQNNPQAADNGPGSKDKPFKSISASLAQVKPGDIVWIHKGVYREFVELKKLSGAGLASMISFQACTGEEVVIKGSDVVTGWKPFKDKVWVVENYPLNVGQVFVDGKLLQQIGGDLGSNFAPWWKGRKGNVQADMTENSFFCDPAAKKLYVWLPGGEDPNQRLVEASVRNCWSNEGDFIRASGLNMLHGIGYSMGVFGKFNMYENVKVEWSGMGALGVHGTDHIFIGCQFNYSGCTGIAGSVRRARFINCKMLGNNYRRISAYFEAGGVKLIPFNHDVVFDGCEAAYNVESPGIWFDGFASNATIQNCLLHHNGGAGIEYEICERGMICNNICYENGSDGIQIAASSYTAVLHNTCYRNATSGITVIGASRVDTGYGRGEESYLTAGHNLVWGNLLVDNCAPDLCPKGLDGSGHTWDKRPELVLPQGVVEAEANNLSDYNIYYRSDGRPIPFWKGYDNLIGKDLAEWQQKSGQDKHSIIADPKFVNIAKRDFHLAADSPALWMAKPSMAVATDFEGKCRPIGMLNVPLAYYTVGALEPDEQIMRARLVSTRPAEVGQFALVQLPKDRTQFLFGYGSADFDYTRDGIYAALATFKVKNFRGRTGIEIAGVPFEQSTPSCGMVLIKDKPAASIPVGKAVKKLHILFAAVAPGKEGVAAECVIKREDGKAVSLAWEASKTLAPAVGDWKGRLQAGPGPDAKTEVAWEGDVSYGTSPTTGAKSKIRLLRTTWRNENEWYPVKELIWTLKNPEAQIVILGITSE